MAILMYSTTKDTKNMRPSQEDAILMLNAPVTKFLAMLKQGKKPKRLLHEYFATTTPAAVTTAVPDGTSRTISDGSNWESSKYRLRIRPSKTDCTVSIGNMTAAAEDQNGIADIHADNVKRAKMQVTRSIENVLLGLQDSSISTDTHTTRSMGCWLGLTSVTDSTDCPIDSNVAVRSAAVVNLGTDALASTVTEANIRGIFQTIFEATGQSMDDAMAFCTASMQSAVSNFVFSASVGDTTATHTVPLRNFTQAYKDSGIGYAVKRYTGDFGSILMVPTTELPTGSSTGIKYPYMYLLDMSVLEYLPLEPLAAVPLPPSTGGYGHNIRASYFLKNANPMRHGVIHWTKS
jgi:hypothetical protein